MRTASINLGRELQSLFWFFLRSGFALWLVSYISRWFLRLIFRYKLIWVECPFGCCWKGAPAWVQAQLCLAKEEREGDWQQLLLLPSPALQISKSHSAFLGAAPLLLLAPSCFSGEENQWKLDFSKYLFWCKTKIAQEKYFRQKSHDWKIRTGKILRPS